MSGWLLVYVVGSLVVHTIYAAGLAGWVLDYPIWLFAGIFAALTVPLVLLVAAVPSAPAWNVAGLWVGAGSITTRVLDGVRRAERPLRPSWAPAVLVAVPVLALGWASTWTVYLLTSDRVAHLVGW